MNNIFINKFIEQIKKQQFVINYSRILPYVKPYWFRALMAMLICIPIGSLDAVIALSLKPYVDLVIPEYNWEQKISDIKEYRIDIFVMGDDWKGKFDFLKNYCEVIYLPRTPNISTTKIKTEVLNI